MVIDFLVVGEGCGFFLWHDPKMCEREKVMINNMKRENKQLQ